PLVRYLDDEPSGLAMMLGGLLEANIDAHPERRRLLSPPATVGIVATDAGVAMTLHVSPAGVTVANGLAGSPAIVVRTDSETLTDLSSVPLRLGLPDATKPAGRAVLGKLRSRSLTVSGMFTHPVLLSRLNRLLSVA
ncbi:MAG TPA: hypothetical protein VG709_04565, partial [Actinomycetota bacterium]|nr:hypothetical protein [Actinomycetota bacterium]